MHRVYLGLGSNLGDRKSHLDEALRRLAESGSVHVLRVSAYHQTEPMGGPPQGKYLNAAAELETHLSPRGLLALCRRTETAMGRVRGERWGARVIDLDILLWGERVVNEPDLVVPHALMHERRFVLEPLVELAPDVVHPTTGKTVRELLEELKQSMSKAGRRRVKVARTVKALRRLVAGARGAGKSIGFVPTMGALHAGHVSLVKRSVKETGFTVVSVFVNPTQFGPGEDLARYPRSLARDVKLAGESGADVVFVPDEKEMYPRGASTWVTVEGLTAGLCGKSRPEHFRGVTTVVTKLLNAVGPDVVFFGRKDAQQALVIKRMVKDLLPAVKVKICPTVREPDGLAMSSRNVYLSETERRLAPVIHRALLAGRRAIQDGEMVASHVKNLVRRTIEKVPGAKVDYVEIVDVEKLEPMEYIHGRALLAAAVFFGDTRLIDNEIVKV